MIESMVLGILVSSIGVGYSNIWLAVAGLLLLWVPGVVAILDNKR